MSRRSSATARATTAHVVESRRPHPDVWREALRLAGGDARRVEVLEDGSVRVLNRRVR